MYPSAAGWIFTEAVRATHVEYFDIIINPEPEFLCRSLLILHLVTIYYL